MTLIRPLSVVACVLSLLFAAGLAAIHAQPNDAQAIRDFLGSPTASCLPPCFMGIRAGETSLEEAQLLLSRNSWVKKIYQTEARVSLAWDWNGQQPKWIDASSPGHLASDNDQIVSYIDVQTNISAGALWLAYGVPSRGFITPRARQMTHFIGYPDAGIDAYLQLACPARQRQFWNARAYVYWGVAWRPSTADNDYPRLWRQHVTC